MSLNPANSNRIGAAAMSVHIVFCNGVFVVCASFPLTAGEAWQYARYNDRRLADSVRVFPCDTCEQAAELAKILA